MSTKGFTAPQVSDLINIPYATLDSWVRSEVFVPSMAHAKGRGTRRMYSFFDILILKVVTTLRNQGINPESLKELIMMLREKQSFIEKSNANQYVLFASGFITLIDKGKMEEIMEQLYDAKDLFITIPIGRLVKKLKFDIITRGILETDLESDSKVKVG